MAQSWSFSIDNDILFGSDDMYTGGMQIGWMSHDLGEGKKGSFGERYTGALVELAEAIIPFNRDAWQCSGGLSVQGIAITPKDTNRKDPDYEDVPYLGATIAAASLFVRNDQMLHEVQIGVGVIGSVSGAADMQNGIHRLIGNSEPQGWDNQLGNRLLLQAGYLLGLRRSLYHSPEGLGLEWFGNLHAGAGTGYIGSGVGSVLRIGRNTPKNFITASGMLNNSLTHQLDFGHRARTLGWGVNAGIALSHIGYFYLYEAARDEGYHFKQPDVIISGRFGLDLFYKNVQVSLELYPSRPLDSYITSNYFARLHFVWEFE